MPMASVQIGRWRFSPTGSADGRDLWLGCKPFGPDNLGRKRALEIADLDVLAISGRLDDLGGRAVLELDSSALSELFEVHLTSRLISASCRKGAGVVNPPFTHQ